MKGVHESSTKALRIMQITTVMVVAFLIWCPITLLVRGGPAQIPPAPLPHNLVFADDALGWFKGTIFPSIPLIALTIAFGHSLLSMSGFETLAQIYREVSYPKLKNLKITGTLVCAYALVCTGLITLFAGLIIPDNVRGNFQANLLSGLATWLARPPATAPAVPRVRRVCRCAYFVRSREHRHHRRERRHESRGRRWRFAGLVPQAA